LAYVDGLKVLGAFEPLNTVAEYSNKFLDIDGSNWFFNKIDREFEIYKLFFGSKGNIEEALELIGGSNGIE
jgi:hypothetical protein